VPQGLELLKDLLSIEVPLTLNEAFCDHHRKHCPKSEELDRECSKVGALQCTGPDCLCRCNTCQLSAFGPDILMSGTEQLRVWSDETALRVAQRCSGSAGGEGCCRVGGRTEEGAVWDAVHRP
jgi:hypothetical protein